MVDTSKLYDKKGAKDVDPRDYSDKYNTPLSDEDEGAYQKWAKENKREKDTYDYDMRGAWKEGAGQADNGHFPDTHKKPNHPTFSDQSKFHGVDGHEGGQWGKDGDRDTFKPGKTNKKMFTPDERKKYFKDVEPNADLSEDE